MLTYLLVIEKINNDGSVDVFQITSTSSNFQWTYETNRLSSINDKEFFPYSLFGKYKIIKRKPGAETHVYLKDNEITFIDDYGVPAGSVISILLPQNYIPDVIKFKDKPYIPVGFTGQVSTSPPGYFQILYNSFEKRSTIIFNINYPTVFGFKCIAKKVSDIEFPSNEGVEIENIFDVSIGRELLNVESIQNSDLKIINDTIKQADLPEIQKVLNELLVTLKSGQREKSKTLLENFNQLIVNGTSVSSSLVTMADSYKAGGAAHQFISNILKYIYL